MRRAIGTRSSSFWAASAVYFRESPAALVVTLLALAGSFMVSYGSAKAEALGVAVPPGVMRRAERAVCLCLATVAMTPWGWLVARAAVPAWAAAAPLLAAVGVIAVLGNISAVRRLRLLGRGASGPALHPQVAPLAPTRSEPPPSGDVPARELARESSA